MPNIVTQRHEWSIQDQPAATVRATISRAADADGRHIARSITISDATVGTASGIVTFNLRDGATDAGTILWSCKLSTSVNQSKSLSVPVNIQGSKNTAMTLESATGGGVTSQITVALTGYTETDVVQRVD